MRSFITEATTRPLTPSSTVTLYSDRRGPRIMGISISSPRSSLPPGNGVSNFFARAKHIFDRAKKFETPFPGGREDRGDDIEIPMIRGPRLSEYSVTVELGVRGRVVASVIKLLIRFLRSVVGKRLTAYLPSGEAAPVGESREEDRIHRASLLQDIEHGLGSFINKRHRADLDADHLSGRLLSAGERAEAGRGAHRRQRRGFGEAAACHGEL